MEYFDTDMITAQSVAVEDYYSRFTGEEIDARLAEVMPHVQNSAIHVTNAERSAWNGKQPAISDLAAIRRGSELGSTAYGWGDHRAMGYGMASDIPTLTSQLRNDSGFLTEHQALPTYALGVTGDCIRLLKDGVGQGDVTVPYATRAKELGGNSDCADLDAPLWSGNGGLVAQTFNADTLNAPAKLDNANYLLNIGGLSYGETGKHYGWQLAFQDYEGEMYARNVNPSGAGNWRKFAFLDAGGKVAGAVSADKLGTVRSIWGQSFDGTGNVSGDMNNVGYVNFTPRNNRNGAIIFDDNAFWFSVNGHQPIIMWEGAASGHEDGVQIYGLFALPDANVRINGGLLYFQNAEAHIGCNNSYVDPCRGVNAGFKFGGSICATSAMFNGSVETSGNIISNGTVIGFPKTFSGQAIEDTQIHFQDAFFTEYASNSGCVVLTNESALKPRFKISNGGAEIWWDGEHNAYRFNCNIIASGNVAGYGGLGMSQDIELTSLITSGDVNVGGMLVFSAGVITETEGDMLCYNYGSMSIYNYGIVSAVGVNGGFMFPLLKVGNINNTSIEEMKIETNSTGTYLIVNGNRFKAV